MSQPHRLPPRREGGTEAPAMRSIPLRLAELEGKAQSRVIPTDIHPN